MKILKTVLVIAALLTASSVDAQQQAYQEINFADSTGLPGDNFSLEAALNLFKNSKSLEEFERNLNARDSAINNLDLNGDGKTDYIKVSDHASGDAHAVVLQIDVNETEKQDVAVIEIEKTGDQSAVAQIIGDEELYGEQTIVEPVDQEESPDVGGGGGKKGPSAPVVYAPQYVYVNVWFWPCVSYMYAPGYVIWVSPWYWGYYPPYWYPWPCYNWNWYYMHNWHHHAYYHRTYYHRTTYAHHQVYAPRRATSPRVVDRNRSARARYTATRPASRPAVTPRPATRPEYAKPGTRPDQTKPAVQPRPKQPEVKPSTPPRTPQPSRPPGGTVQPSPKSPQPSRPPSQPARPPRTPSGQPK